MTISEDKAVSVNYYLTAKKGEAAEELIEETTVEHPFVFLFGFGAVLPDFESNLKGKAKGDKFDFKIQASHGYGLYEKDYVINIARAAFEVDGKFDEARVKVGQELEMTDADGNPLVGKILEIDDKEVKMDFNHPLAGYELHFIGDVIDVRDASKEELEHGHIHGPHGNHH